MSCSYPVHARASFPVTMVPEMPTATLPLKCCFEIDSPERLDHLKKIMMMAHPRDETIPRTENVHLLLRDCNNASLENDPVFVAIMVMIVKMGRTGILDAVAFIDRVLRISEAEDAAGPYGFSPPTAQADQCRVDRRAYDP